MFTGETEGEEGEGVCSQRSAFWGTEWTEESDFSPVT